MRFGKQLIWIILLFSICSFASIEAFPRVEDTIGTNSINSLKDNEPNDILSDNQLFVDLDICESTECQKTGEKLKTNLNISVDPCDDFYEFACGGWIANHEIPDNYPYYFDGLQKGIEIQKSLNESLNELKGKSGPKPLVYASELYQSCLDTTTRKTLGVKPITDALKRIGGWPLVSGSFNETYFDWTETMANIMSITGEIPLFSFTIDPDANDTQVNRFYFNKNWLPLRIKILALGTYSKAVQSYKQNILTTALAVGAKNDSQTHKQIDELVDFEAKLMNETINSRDDSPLGSYNRMTFKALNNITDNRFDWIQLMNNIYEKLNSSVRVSSEELVIVSDPKYYKIAIKLLGTLPKRVQANYLGYILANTIGQFTLPTLDNYMTEDSDNNDHQVKFVTDNEKNDWACLTPIGNYFKYVLARLYVQSSFTKKDKELSSVVIKDIKNTFNELLRGNQWLDSTTKNKTLEKLTAIKENVGYPDWILNDTQFENYHNFTKRVDSKNFVDSILYVMVKTTTNSYNTLRQKPNLDYKWSFIPFTLNAAYEPTQNAITIPAAFLTPPQFNSKLPAQINYGAIGTIVAHELTHAFDDDGSQYDLNGNLRNWWTEEAAKRFKLRAECFVKEYNILDKQTQMMLNGTKTLPENIADNGGIREAYNAYLKYVERHGKQRLPFVSNYSAEQQFFISYANTWCMKYKTEYLKQIFASLGHSPNKYRVNVPLSNFQSFSDVFKCSTNSQMNRKDKCILW